MSTPSRPSKDFLIALGALLAAPVAAGALLWLQFTPQEREACTLLIQSHPSSVVTTGAVLLASLAFALRWAFVRYIEPMRKLVEEVELIGTANPGYRLNLGEKGDVAHLGKVINAAAERLEQAQATLDAKIREANAIFEKERNSLAALIEQLSEGVILCASEGQILLYNRRARDLLAGPSENAGTDANASVRFGLGRSIFPLVDRQLFQETLDAAALDGQDLSTPRTTKFLMRARAGEILEVRASTVREQKGPPAGFVLLLSDITGRVARDDQQHAVISSLREELRRSLPPLKAAAETLNAFSALDSESQNRLRSVIQQETMAIAEAYAKILKTDQDLRDGHWRFERVSVSVLLSLFKRRAEQTIEVELLAGDSELNLAADSQELIEVFTHLARAIKDESGITALRATCSRKDSFIAIDFEWTGPAVPQGVLSAWESHPIEVPSSWGPTTLGEVLKRHGGSAWVEADERGSHLRLLFPESRGGQAHSIKPPGRELGGGGSFDFALPISNAGTTLREDARLTDLAYTAFDTETTGLNPTGGDQIISVGAVRIVNGRVLKEESFNQLVDPLRSITREATSIHGIEHHMVAGKPRIESVLPAFHSFASGTVLVAHNGDFDMRFIQMKEQAAGVQFEGPLLDTLLLSAVVHPNQEDQSLEEIARRLGVPLSGRHTALGDAIITGEVFLKLVGLLKERGIVTLGGAISASKRVPFSGIRY